MLSDTLIVVAAYLLGAVPFAFLVPRIIRGDDIRGHGSGNVGASNVFRVYGRSLGIPVAILDVAKGFAPALLGLLVGGAWVGVLAGIAAMLGHARPIWFGFARGGKMVATAGGVSLALAPLAALACLALWVVVFAATRFASLASILTAAALPFACAALGADEPIVGFAALACVGIVLLHRQNIKRLLAGTEPRFGRTPPAS